MVICYEKDCEYHSYKISGCNLKECYHTTQKNKRDDRMSKMSEKDIEQKNKDAENKPKMLKDVLPSSFEYPPIEVLLDGTTSKTITLVDAEVKKDDEFENEYANLHLANDEKYTTTSKVIVKQIQKLLEVESPFPVVCILEVKEGKHGRTYYTLLG